MLLIASFAPARAILEMEAAHLGRRWCILEILATEIPLARKDCASVLRGTITILEKARRNRRRSNAPASPQQSAALAQPRGPLPWVTMANEDDTEATRWAEVEAKALAMLALQGSKISNRLEQAEFLMGL